MHGVCTLMSLSVPRLLSLLAESAQIGAKTPSGKRKDSPVDCCFRHGRYGRIVWCHTSISA